MAYKIKTGRPRVNEKIRNLEGITPKGFEFDRIENGKVAIYKRKKKNAK
jgi:hypothetical protein